MNNIFRIIIVKINIMKANIIKIYINKTHVIIKNVTLSESALKTISESKTILSLENTTLSSFSSILLVTNQSGTNINVGRKALTALLHNS